MVREKLENIMKKNPKKFSGIEVRTPTSWVESGYPNHCTTEPLLIYCCRESNFKSRRDTRRISWNLALIDDLWPKTRYTIILRNVLKKYQKILHKLESYKSQNQFHKKQNNSLTTQFDSSYQNSNLTS